MWRSVLVRASVREGSDTGTIARVLGDRCEQKLSWAMTSLIVGSAS
jgi:hypothetical protein